MLLRVAFALCLFLWSGAARADRFYFVLFCHDSRFPLPHTNHVWATWARQSDDGKIVDQHTISWMPRGDWHLLDRAKPGYNLGLEESLDYAVQTKKVIRCWGPFETDQSFYDAAEERWRKLPDEARYKAIDGLSRRRAAPAINCYHAVSDTAGTNYKTHVRYGLWAAESIARHFQKQQLIRETPDSRTVYKLLGLNQYPVRKMR